MDNSIATPPLAAIRAETTRFKVLGAIGVSHFLNDMIQSLIIAIYPLSYYGFYLIEKFHLPVQTGQLYLFTPEMT